MEHGIPELKRTHTHTRTTGNGFQQARDWCFCNEKCKCEIYGEFSPIYTIVAPRKTQRWMRVRTCHACIHSNPCQEIMIKREIFRHCQKVIHLFVIVLSRWCWQSAQLRLLETDDENLDCLFSRFFCEKQGLTIFPHCRILTSPFVCKKL